MGARALALLAALLALVAAPRVLHAAGATPLSDTELDEVVGAGLFFEINLQNGLMRVAIASRVQSLATDTSTSTGSQGTLDGAQITALSSPVINAGNVSLSGSAQQNLRALANVNAAGSVVQLLINILVVNLQNNSGTLNILQPQIAAFGF